MLCPYLSKKFIPALWRTVVQVNLCQKLLFLHQLTHNMMTNCSLFMKIVSSEYLQNMLCTQIVVFVLFWHSEQFWYTTCSADVASFWKRFTCNWSKIFSFKSSSIYWPPPFRFSDLPLALKCYVRIPICTYIRSDTMKPTLFWIQIWWHQTFFIIYE